jgi:hypothetical protein
MARSDRWLCIVAVYLGPETKGMVMTADLEVIEAEVTLG